MFFLGYMHFDGLPESECMQMFCVCGLLSSQSAFVAHWHPTAEPVNAASLYPVAAINPMIAVTNNNIMIIVLQFIVF